MIEHPESRFAECGHASFFVVVALPLMLALSILLLDVSKWQQKRTWAQTEADRLAERAAYYLPDRSAAESYLGTAIQTLQQDSAYAGLRKADLGLQAQVVTGSDFIRLRLFGNQALTFARFLPVEDAPLALSFSETTEIQLVPNDLVLILSDAVTTRPPLLTAWGEAEQWPPARYFEQVQIPCEAAQYSTLAQELSPLSCRVSPEAYARWATQSCFNPLLSELKLAALQIIDFVNVSRVGRLAVLTTPGNGSQGYQVLAELRAAGSKRVWSTWQDPSLLISDEVCVFAAEYSDSNFFPYVQPPPGYQSAVSAAAVERRCSPLQAGFPFDIHLISGMLAPCWREQVDVRDLVYYHASRSRQHLPLDQGVEAALRAAELEILESPPGRGTISSLAMRSIVLLSDRLPEPGGWQQAAQDGSLQYFLIGVSHQSAPGHSERLAEMRKRAALWNEHQHVFAFAAGSAEELRSILDRKVLPRLHQPVMRL